VSKGVAAERVHEAFRAGHDLFGENRIQEAEDKIERLAVAPFANVPDAGSGSRARWHLLGHLQSNKARRAVDLFEAIHSVDSLDLASRLDRLAAEGGQRLPVYLQVNVDADPSKSGFAPDDLERDLDALLALETLEPLGLMTVGTLAGDGESARPTFERLAALSARLCARDGRLGAGLSMGMSDDFEVAIDEGSTCVRIGRAIFGERTDTPMP
jgi:pyridoxal phosphate enzyme (YggS family)